MGVERSAAAVEAAVVQSAWIRARTVPVEQGSLFVGRGVSTVAQRLRSRMNNIE